MNGPSWAANGYILSISSLEMIDPEFDEEEELDDDDDSVGEQIE